jgi:spermidine synthase
MPEALACPPRVLCFLLSVLCLLPLLARALQQDAEVLASRPGLSGGLIQVRTLENGHRALSFGEDDIQTELSNWNAPGQAPLVVDAYMHVALMGLAQVEAVRSSAAARCDEAAAERECRASPQVLLVGLGGGAFARYARRVAPQLNVTVVELEPAVIALAQEFLGFVPDDKLHVVCADAREFLSACAAAEGAGSSASDHGASAGKAFDMIFMDGCDEKGTAPQLNTPEFVSNMKQALLPGGVLAVNIVALDAFDPALLSSTLQMYEDLGFSVAVFQVYSQSVLLCTLDARLLSAAAAVWAGELDPGFDYRALHSRALVDRTDPLWLQRLALRKYGQSAKLALANSLGEAVDVLWDGNPVPDGDCGAYPVAAHKSQASLALVSTLLPGERVDIDSYMDHFFVVVRVDSQQPVVCISMDRQEVSVDVAAAA